MVWSLNGDNPLAKPIQKVGDIVDFTAKSAEKNLTILESPFGGRPRKVDPLRRSNGSVVSPDVRSTVIPMGPLADKLSEEEAGHLLSVGGSECDCCKGRVRNLVWPT